MTQALRFLTLAASLALPLSLAAASNPPETLREAAAQPKIQIALLLDTSSSMQGLIDQAKTRLWRVVNEFVLAKRDGKRPVFEVALYEYGNKNLPAASGFVRKVSQLTTDLDAISAGLFGLEIQSFGSQEYCGSAIQAAADQLDWSSADDLKVICIAGNESFAQGDRDYKEATKAAITRGIQVNTIFCGTSAQGVQLGWKDAARRADGAFTSIDQNQVAQQVRTPLDKEIEALGVKLNETYIPYGRSGRLGADNQVAQDRNAESSAGSGVSRAVTKGSRLYSNAHWDLVDALREKRFALKDVKKEALPKELRKLSLSQLEKYCEDNAKERSTIQSRIAELNRARKLWLAKPQSAAPKGEAKGPGSSRRAGLKSLDAALVEILRSQAAKKRFRFTPEPIPQPPSEAEKAQAPEPEAQTKKAPQSLGPVRDF